MEWISVFVPSFISTVALCKQQTKQILLRGKGVDQTKTQESTELFLQSCAISLFIFHKKQTEYSFKEKLIAEILNAYNVSCFTVEFFVTVQ